MRDCLRGIPNSCRGVIKRSLKVPRPLGCKHSVDRSALHEGNGHKDNSFGDNKTRP